MNDHEDDDLVEDGPLTAERAPVLAELWDNEDDAVYDDPEWQGGGGCRRVQRTNDVV
jgi:hypothetical protein